MRKTSSLLAIIVATVSLAFVVYGQGTQSKKPGSKSVSSKPASQVNTQKRSRRTSESTSSAAPTTAASPETQATRATTAEKPAEPKAVSSPATETQSTSTTTAEKPVEPNATASPTTAAATQSEPTQPSPKPAASAEATSAPDDPVASLREEIDGAETLQERIQLQLKLADLLVLNGKKDDALTELHRVVSSDVFAPQDLYNAGNSLARLGDMDGAIDAYRKAIDQRKGRYSRAYNNLGVVLLRAGRWQESYEALIAALRIENFLYPEASYNLGRLYATRGENDLAVREWQRVLKQNPNHTATREALARLGKQGTVEVVVASTKVPPPPKRSEEAASKPVFTSEPKASDKPVAVKPPAKPKPTVLTVDPDTYDFLVRARNSNERGKTLDAISNYKKAISKSGGYLPPANLELSYLLIVQKQFDEALENLTLVANRDGSQFPISYFHLARLYEARGDFKQAEAAFGQAAAAYKPTNYQFLLDLSRVREKQENYKGALEALEQYVQAMKQQGQTVSWSDERRAALRKKLNPPK